MANYFLHVKTFARGQGSKVTKAAAYRAGERIRDERTSAIYDHTHRTDVAHAEIVLPSAIAERVDMEWALDRSRLWNAAEHSGRQWNSRMAREILVHVPPELTPTQRIQLVRGFSRELANRYGNAVDFAIHVPRPQADPRHYHAHLLMTTRQVGPDGLGARTSLDLSGTERRARGLGASKDDLLWMRERWAEVTNEALREAGLAIRVDHRSYQTQGIDREPQPMMPRAILYSERRSGLSHPAGDDIRGRYRERVEARLKGSDELARVLERQREENRQRALQSRDRQASQKKLPNGALTREQLNEKRREYCKANSERINRKQRERRQANAAEVNRKQRERRQANLEEVKRREREYYLSRRAQRQAAKRPLENAGALAQKPSSASAEQSVQNWLAYRERQTKTASAEGPSQARSRDSGAARVGHSERESADRNNNRARKNDHTL